MFQVLEEETREYIQQAPTLAPNQPRTLMDNLTSWNVYGLNWLIKKAEVKLFLQSNKVGLMGLLETKVKVKNVEKVAASIFHG